MVLILDRENGIDAMQERFKRLDIVDETALIVWGGWLEQGAPEPAAPAVLDWVRKTEPKPVVVVDTLVAFLDGDENSASDVRKFMGQLRQLTNLGATVIAVHHSSEKGEKSHEYRGSSDFKGSIDVGINVRNSGHSGLGEIRLKPFKARFAIDGDVVLSYSNGRFVVGDRRNSAPRAVNEPFTRLLRENPGIKQSEFEKLATKRKLGRNQARDYIERGVRTGEIRVVKGTHNARLHYLSDPAGQIGGRHAENDD